MAARCLEDLPSTSLRGGLRRELDVAVVGAGVLGLATTDALVRRGVDVVCFDPGRPGQGQSGGWSRSFRNRHDDPRVVGLAVESRTGWSRWEDRLGQRLIGDEGTAYAGMAADDAHGLVVHEVSHAFVEPSRQAEVFGALAPMDGLLLHDPASGAIRARRTIDALVGWVGSRIVPAEVHGVTAPGDGDGAELHTADGIFRARHVVIAAGTATPGSRQGPESRFRWTVGSTRGPTSASGRSSAAPDSRAGWTAVAPSARRSTARRWVAPGSTLWG